MPAYDYRCVDCDHVFEVKHAIGENTGIACPLCASETKRVFSPVGVVFKGSGFHTTDYRAKPKPESSDAPSCPKKDSDSSSCASCPAAE